MICCVARFRSGSNVRSVLLGSGGLGNWECCCVVGSGV